MPDDIEAQLRLELARKQLKLDQARAFLVTAAEHLEHKNHGTDKCFACFLEDEIHDVLEGYPKRPPGRLDGPVLE